MKTILFSLVCAMTLLAATYVGPAAAQADNSPATEIVTAPQAPCPPVDTVENIGDIIDGGLFYLRNAPAAGSPIDEWVAYVIGIIGFLFGVYKHVKGNSAARNGGR